MTNSTLNVLSQRDLNCIDPLTELLKKGARDLIATVVEAELQLLLEQHSNLCLVDGRQAVVHKALKSLFLGSISMVNRPEIVGDQIT